VDALNDVIARSNGRRGLAALLALLEYDPAPARDSKSDLESALLDLVREVGLPLPQLNVLVDGYLVDAHCLRRGLSSCSKATSITLTADSLGSPAYA